MDPTTEQKELGDSKASLAFSNMLREQLFMQENPPMEEGIEEPVEGMEPEPLEAPVEPEIAPEPEVAPEPEEPAEDPIKGLEERLTKRIDELENTLKEEQNEGMKKEMDEIKKTLKDISA